MSLDKRKTNINAQILILLVQNGKYSKCIHNN